MSRWPAFFPHQESSSPDTAWNQAVPCDVMVLFLWEMRMGEYGPGETFGLERFKGLPLSHRKSFAGTKGKVRSWFYEQQNRLCCLNPRGRLGSSGGWEGSPPHTGFWREHPWRLKSPLSFSLLCRGRRREVHCVCCWLLVLECSISVLSWDRVNIFGVHITRHK